MDYLDLMRANELSYISTIIKAAAATRDWSATLGSKTAGKVQEVQCMKIKDKLFIAGNFDKIDEGALIKAYLSSFGVSNRSEFDNCMRYSHELLSLDNQQWLRIDKTKVANDSYRLRKVTVDIHTIPKYSPQDNSVIQGFAAVKPIFLASGFSDEELGAVMNLIAKPSSTESSRNQHHAWFLRHFLGISEASGAIKANGQPNAYVNRYSASLDINIVKSIKGVHAELTLLTFLARELLTNPLELSGQVIYLGGSKNACMWCKAWIDNYRRWIKEWFGVKILLPSEYTSAIEDLKRPNGSGAGQRPTLEGIPYSGEFAKKLFNGEAGGNCLDLTTTGDTSSKLLAWAE